MHVLKIPSWYGTPAFPVQGVFFKQQALSLASAGHRVGVVYPDLRSVHTLGHGRIHFGRQALPEGPIQTYRYYGFRLPRQPGRFRRRWTKAAVDLARMYVVDHGMPDVIHAHSAVFAGDVARQLAEELRVPYVLTEHSMRYLGGPLTLVQKSCTIEAIRSASAVIAVSHRLREALQQLTQRKNIHVIPNLIDTRRFAPPALPRLHASFRFVCVGLLVPWKNVQLLLRAFHRAFSGIESVALDIVGDGKERSRLEKLVRSMNERHRISFCGMLDTDGVVRALARSHCCVSSSNVETFGVTLIEALASGIPVIATRSGGPEDIVTRECGHLVPIGDERALADAMYEVYLKRARWADQSDSLSSHARRTYGEQAVVSRIECVYRAL